jgi:hypothetical protein
VNYPFLKPEDFESIFSSLKIETYSKSIGSLFGPRLLSRIDYKPYYQRNYVWDDNKASYFIESILLGTEIPPLIFFNNGTNFEVIDGRQRFETIKRFKNSEFALTHKGLSVLKLFVKATYESLKKDNLHIIDLFLDATIRIIELEILDSRALDPELEDKIKKEVFSRYNSGITPLKRPEIDNAVYNKDPITQHFKTILKNEPAFKQSIQDIFFKHNQEPNELLAAKILPFIRRQLILNKFPVKYYARGTGRTEILTKLYDYFLTRTENIEVLCYSFIEKVRLVGFLKQTFSNCSYNHNRLVFECLLWILLVLENEKFNLSRLRDIEVIKRIGKSISDNLETYTEINSHFYNNIMGLLTILGFIGQQYLDEENQTTRPRNWRYSLRGLRILKKLQGKKFTDLEAALRDKILDFELLIVEIEERFNPEFNPVDLFIRLNDKPYPIRENSFEMWNSWVEREVIAKIKENVSKHLSWFYLKLARNRHDRDRMENEELYTSLIYLEFEKLKKREILSCLDIYRNTDWINARIRSIKGISNLLALISENAQEKQHFLDSLKNVESFIYKVRLVLLDKDIIDKGELSNYLKSELDGLYKARKESHTFKRTKQDFYILWYALNPLNLQMVKHYRLEIKKEILEIFYQMKNVPPATNSNDRGAESFISSIKSFHQKYQMQSRQTKLSQIEKESLIKEQGNRCGISGAPIFLGDEIEIDHKKSLAIGGSDSKENLQITHKDSNRRKGAK